MAFRRGSLRISSVLGGGKKLATAKVVIKEKPEPDQPGRPDATLVERKNEAHRQMICGAMAQSTSRSISASRTSRIRNARDIANRHGSAWWHQMMCLKQNHSFPPKRPNIRDHASRAIPQPLMPPPMTKRSRLDRRTRLFPFSRPFRNAAFIAHAKPSIAKANSKRMSNENLAVTVNHPGVRP